MRKFLYVVLGIIVLFFIVAAIAPKDYEVVRSTEINQPSDVVYDYIKYLNNQDNFSTWANMDPDMKKTFKGEDGTVGYVSRWESENEDVGVGEQEIIKMEDGKRIDYELRFESPWESTSPAWLAVSTTNSGLTKVEWGFSGHMDYPMNIMLLFMDMEEMLGKDLQDGLNNLKGILESN
jgi:uncharacterized protein YndB with AHSA1/START domain